MDIQFVFKLEKASLDAFAFTKKMEHLASILLYVHADYALWFMTPSGPKDKWIPLSDIATFEAKIARKNPPGDLLIGTITNRQNEADWYKPGCATLRYVPSKGDLRFEIFDADIFFGGSLYKTMKDILRAFVMEEWIEWASLDCSVKVPDERPSAKQGKMRTLDLSIDYRTFPHREFIGWMGWIQQLPPSKLLQALDLPQAAEVHPLPGRSGTMVISVGEVFDMANPAHIERMQKVEVRLVDLGLLPVIDPEFM